MTGVVTKDRVLTGRKVILASGGFGASPELLSQYIPKAVDIPFPGHYGSTGDGIKMGLAVGSSDGEHGRLPALPRIRRSGKARGVARGGSIRRHHGRPWRKALR